jgi:hypothetical protein
MTSSALPLAVVMKVAPIFFHERQHNCFPSALFGATFFRTGAVACAPPPRASGGGGRARAPPTPRRRAAPACGVI